MRSVGFLNRGGFKAVGLGITRGRGILASTSYDYVLSDLKSIDKCEDVDGVG